MTGVAHTLEEEHTLTKAELIAIAARGYDDPVYFLKFFLWHLFPGPIPWFHRGALAILTRKVSFLEQYGELDKIIKNFYWLEDPKDENSKRHHIFYYTEVDGVKTLEMHYSEYTLLMWPRGFSKTTLAGIGVPTYEACYQDCPFTLYVSESGPHAEAQLTNVQRELSGNSRVKLVFGELKPERSDAKKWTSSFFETTTGIAFAARGRGGQVRGLNHLGVRPHKIIIDDVEDKESVSTALQREKVREWAYADLLPALPSTGSDRGQLIGLGTLLHPEALMEVWASDPDFTVVRFGAVDDAGEPLWPESKSLEELERIKQRFARAGQLHTYYMEYFNRARTPETQIFKPEYIIRDSPPQEEALTHVVYIDPAISNKPGADFTSVTAVAMGVQSGHIWVREQWNKRGATPREQVDHFFRLVRKFGAQRAGAESNAYQAALVHLLREEMFRSNLYFELFPVTHSAKKSERIEGILQPRYAAGYMHHEGVFPELEACLFDWPTVAHDDPADSLAGAVALLDPYAAHAIADQDLLKDEFEPHGKWRHN